MAGWVYVISVSSVPNHVKVGFTDRDPEQRAKELESTGVPGRYEVRFSVRVDDARAVEQQTHALLRAHHHSKEWFECSAEQAQAAVETAAAASHIYWKNSEHETYPNYSPLVPGHPLEPYFNGRPLYPPGLPSARLSLDQASSTSLHILSGQLVYFCQYCGSAAAINPSSIVVCPHCGQARLVSW